MPKVESRKPKAGSRIAVFALLLAPAAALAFDSGSNGSYGSMDIVADTVLDLPADGVYHCTTITVAAGKSLKFRRNPLNTPVYLLATGDVVVDGAVDVSGSPGTPYAGGQGGPGGFDGGGPALFSGAAGWGQGPGGGAPGSASCTVGQYATGGSCSTSRVYGSPLLVPLVGGSGGAGVTDMGGAGGGGAILIASSTSIRVSNTGAIRADGGYAGWSGPHGSGGAIRLVASSVSGGRPGSGSNVSAAGGSYGISAGAGRIRIETISRSGIGMSFSPSPSVGAFLVAIPPSGGKLDLVSVAGQSIPVGTANPVTVLLPFGSSPAQQVTVRATNFVGPIPVAVVLTPESGDRVVYETQIQTSGTPPTGDVTLDVNFPVNSVTQVNAWTK